MRKVTAAGAMIPVLLLTACGDSSSSTPGQPSDETLQAYFQGIASGTVSSYQESIDLAEPESPAAAYPTFLQAVEQARIDGGTSAGEVMETSVQEVEGGYEYCGDFGGEQDCNTNTDISGARGRVASFSVGGMPLEGHVVLGDDQAVPVSGLDAAATLVAAFETSSTGDLYAVFSVRTGKDADISRIDATYRAADGGQSAADHQEGPSEVAADSSANYMFVFPGAVVGGTVTLDMSDTSPANDGAVTFKLR